MKLGVLLLLLVLQGKPSASGATESAVATASSAPTRTAINPFGTVEEFPAVDARYVRMTILKSSMGEPCIGEFEVFSADIPPRNVALASRGAKASASGSRGPEFQPDNINDGRPGGVLAWIANNPTNGWVQIEMPKVERINRIVWSRDATGQYSDRCPIDYRIEVATEPSAWRQVASSQDHLPIPDLLEIPARDPLLLPKEYVIQKGGEEEAFPHSRVNDITQTPDGYLWLSTEQGLVRFDGNQFKIFNGENTAQFVNGEVRLLDVHLKRRLLIASENRTNRVVVYEHGRFASLNLHDPSFSYAFRDDDGVIWGLSKEGSFHGKTDASTGPRD